MRTPSRSDPNIGFGFGWRTGCSCILVPQAIINGYKNVLPIVVELDYYFPLAEKVEYLKMSFGR